VHAGLPVSTCSIVAVLTCATRVDTTGAVLDRIFIFVVSNPSILPIWPPAANFVVITNGGGCALTGTADIDQQRASAFFPRVAIGCGLLGGVLIGGYMR